MFKKSKFKNRGLGWIENVKDTRDLDFDKMGISPNILESVDLRYLVNVVLDQGRTNSCVGNAVAHAVDILETKFLLPYIPVSRLFLYFNSRFRTSNYIQDDGTFIRNCLWGMEKAGAPEEDIWPFIRSKINKQPTWNSYMKAYGRKDVKYYTIFSTGEGLILELKAALSAGFPVIFGTGIGNEFYDVEPGEVLDIPRTTIGGHAMVIVGYFHHPIHGLVFIVLNSWGDDFADGGFTLFSENYMRWLRSRDFSVINYWAWLKAAHG